MAQRGKRINRSDNDLASCPGAIKRRKCRLGPAAGNSSTATATLGPSEEEETMASSSQGGASWTPRPLNDIKSTIYNRSATEAPAELFRKDLISAMKLPDSEPLSPKEYWVITDQWKQEWERGVQVPVNPDSLPEPAVTVTQASASNKLHGEFKLPKKFIRISRDDWFNAEEHHLSNTPARAEKACAYDLDDTDIAWLGVLNGERAQAGQSSITEPQLERVIEELEVRCWERIQTIVKNAEGLGIEFDENVICDVCRSPDSEEGNEMVFCDCCNICVHQACYGITSIPDGSWLCRTCSLSQRPDCVLCPNKGGAMKCTRSGQKWAHVSCALWIPEVSIGCVERMEPITKISSIPQSRWALICVLCRDRVGACIQCSIKTCKTAYHVTCAFKHGLEMKAIIEDEMADDGVKLRSYCQKHSRTNTKDKVGVGGGVGSSSGKGGSDSEDGEARKRKRKDMTSEEKNQARAAKLQEIEAEFDKHVSLNDITSQQHDVDPDGIVYIYNYWKLKRRAGHNKPLLAPRCGELSGAGARAQGQAADLEKMRTFVQLRQDLERVRNLCYMVGRREKLCRSFLRLREQTFHKQALVMSGPTLPPNATTAVLEANHGPSIYDRLYSHPYAEDHIHDLDVIVARIAGNKSPTPVSSDEKKVQTDFNGVSKENSKMDNPYKKLYLNGSVRRKNLYDSDLSSISNSETDTAKPTVQSPNKTKKLDLATDTSTDEESAPSKLKVDRRKSKKSIITGRSRTLPRDSSESDKMDTAGSRSRTLQQMERELVGGVSGSDSDELLPLNTTFTSRHVLSNPDAIYSDTDSDSQEHAHAAVLRTKAAVKEFSAGDITKNAEKNFVNKDKPQEQYAEEMTKTKDAVKISKKKEYVPTALIVPQRQAAKKASEIMQRSQNKKEMLAESDMIKSPVEETKLLKPAKQKVGKQKDSKTSKDSKNNDIYDFDKEFGDGSEILAYVPQRQAAKKAAEHIKSGMGTKVGQPELETPEAKMKKDSPEQARKKEKEPKKEESPKKSKKLSENATPAAVSSNSESSSSSSCSSSSESSSDSEDCKSSAPYAPTSTVDQVNSASTSSDSDNSNQVEVHTLNKRYNSKSVDNTVESDAVPKKAVGRKIKKLPDKKLKTSDGRHGLEFQPPPFEREESGRSSVSEEQPEQQQQDNKNSDQRESTKNLGSPVRSEKVCSPLSGTRDNDGARNILGPKSTKKAVQIPKQSQQSTVTRKDEPSTITKTKADARKRKSSEVPQKEEKNSKGMATLKKIEKRLTDKSGVVQKCDRKNESSVIEIDGSKESLDDTAVKTDDKKFKKTASKTSVNTLEEEIKQRKAERESPKKSSRGLDKLLEKREHLDKLSKAKKPDDKLETEVQTDEAAQNKEIHPAKISSHNTIKNEDEPNSEKDTRICSHEPDRHSNDFKESAANPFVDFKQKSETKIDIQPEVPTQYGETIVNVDNRDNSNDNVAKSIPTSEKLETGEKDSHRRRKSTNRSIFSPQHGSKDPSDADLFDFDHDLLAVEEMVNDDGFSIPRDPEERAPPLTFSFNNELWFKEDSKEDSARETLHLVEKLRLELSKKSSSGHPELESVTVEDETKKEEVLLEKSTEQNTQDKEIKMLELNTNVIGGVKNNENVNRMSSDLCCKNQSLEEKDKPCYPQEQYVSHNNENMETGKVTVAEREKLDRAEADERWVPPSIENFNPNDVHLNTLMDNRTHCYGGHQFPNDTSISESNNDAIVHSQMNLNIQEQYQLLQQSHQLMRPAQHIDPLSESRVQPIQMVDQVAQLPTQIVDEMVNRHLIGLPNTEGDQGVEIEVHGLEKEDISSDIRQDYNQSESPYTDIGSSRQDTRWAENQVLPSRRSTSSSITSASSTEDHSAMPSYKNIAPIPFPPCSMEQSVYHSYSEASSYAAPVSLFPPQSCATSLPYPSPGTAMFPPPFGAPFPTPQSLLPHVSKPLEDALNMQASPCTAAFTSSSHNMALTAAMISPTKIPTPPPQPQMITDDEQIHEPQQERQEPLPQQPSPPMPTSPPLPPSSLPSHHQQQQASISLQPNTSALPLSFLNNMSETPVSEPVVENLQEMAIENRSTQPGKKSPAKPTRSSARVTSLQAKSPGKSPRQEPLKSVTTTKSRSRAPKSSTQAGYKSRARGRGRGRGRGGQGASITLNASLTNIVHNNDDTIRSKLVGTVYDFDFDEDSATETNIADLRTMRERKKSTDVSEKREGLGILSEGLHLSHLSSPSSHNKYNDNKRLSPPENQNNTGTGDCKSSANQAFSATVLPLLPGPVDMRTYNSTVDAQTSSLHTQSYTNHLLGTFTSGTADQALPDIDEDYEKEFHSALIASKHANTCTDPNLSQPITETPMLNISDSNKVSLTDSRNQLKVKIKGPFLDANYVPASSVPPLAQQAPVIITPTATSASVASGTSSLRRMRKKELLRQYWNQDMNMDDTTCGNVASAPISIPPVSRPGITIPKAVASMTSFPTREDYKAVVDANMEKKRRKERGSILDMVDEDGTSDRRRNSGASSMDKRRGRQARPSATNVANSGLAPKLKIKFGNSILGQELSNMQDDRSRIKPPKKRLSSIPNKPSIEELKRESMKFRRMIMAGFENDEKPKVKSKKDKNGKRKKKHPNKKEGRVQLLDDGPAPPKLIIRLGKGSNTATNVNDVASNETLSVASVVPDDNEVGNLQPSGNNRVGPQPTEPPKEDTNYPLDSNIEDKLPTDPNAGATSLRNIRSAKVTPIRLKLTRCQEGYELKAPAISSACDDSGKVNLNSILAPEDVPVMETMSKESSTKQSSKEDDIPLLSQHTAHNSPNCPPPPLPQGCQVR